MPSRCFPVRSGLGFGGARAAAVRAWIDRCATVGCTRLVLRMRVALALCWCWCLGGAVVCECWRSCAQEDWAAAIASVMMQPATSALVNPGNLAEGVSQLIYPTRSCL